MLEKQQVTPQSIPHIRSHHNEHKFWRF
jgi:hypothetical protein